jgi:hypothetical protein
MTITDYFLLAAFIAAGVYVICRLFVGWRNSASRLSCTDATDGARSAAGATGAASRRNQMTAQH